MNKQIDQVQKDLQVKRDLPDRRHERNHQQFGEDHEQNDGYRDQKLPVPLPAEEQLDADSKGQETGNKPDGR